MLPSAVSVHENSISLGIKMFVSCLMEEEKMSCLDTQEKEIHCLVFQNEKIVC